MNKIITLTDENFNSEVINSEIPVLVDFWASWCAPCLAMAPVLEELAATLEGKIKIAKLDVEATANLNLAMSYQIQSIPNLKLFKNGKVAKELIGFRPKDELNRVLQESI